MIWNETHKILVQNLNNNLSISLKKLINQYIKMTARNAQINADIFKHLPIDVIQYVILPFHDYNVPAAKFMKEHIQFYQRLKERSINLQQYYDDRLQQYNDQEAMFIMDPHDYDPPTMDDMVEDTFAEWMFETHRIHKFMKLEIYM